MQSSTFPAFPYPVTDGTIAPSDEKCVARERERGFIFTRRRVWGAGAKDAKFCPWCISEGKAHAGFGASFNLVGTGAPPEAQDEIRFRTPGFVTWQDWDWPTHCSDVAVYLGQPSGDELRANPRALGVLLRDLRQWEWERDEAYVEEFINGLGSSQVAYLFECRHCGTQLVCWDQD